jgi:hypothetical protein
MHKTLSLLLLLLAVSCNKNKGEQTIKEPIKTQNTNTNTTDPNQNNTKPDEPDDGLETTGTYDGQLSTSEIQPVFQSKSTELKSCYESGKSKNKYLQGEVNIRFEIAPDGKPGKVFTEKSTMGEDEVERCFIGIIEGLNFPKPKGGAVLAAYPFAFVPSAQLAGVGAPSDVDRDAFVAKTKEALKKCKKLPESFQVAAWIDGDGKAMSAGFSAESFDGHASSRECAVAALKKTQFPKSKRKATHLVVASSDL